MVPILLLLLLLVLIFGGLALFVAKLFFIAVAVTVVLGLVAVTGAFRHS